MNLAAARARQAAWSEHAHAPVAAAVVAVVFWGIGPLFIRAIGVSGLSAAAFRLWIGAPVMVALLYATGGRLSARVLRLSAPAGVLFAADVGFGFSAFQHTSLANASLIGALSPVLILLASGPLFGESIRSRDFGWIGLAMLGTAMVVLASADTNSARDSFLGDALAAISMLVWTVYFLYVKRTRVDGVPAFAFMTGVIGCAAVAISPYALLASDDLGQVHGWDFGYLLLMVLGPGALGHGLMTWAHRYVNVNLSSLLTLAGPVVTSIGALVVFGESLTTIQVLGGGLVLIAIGALVIGRNATRPQDSIVPEPLEAE